jgi:hypothetical protein
MGVMTLFMSAETNETGVIIVKISENLSYVHCVDGKFFVIVRVSPDEDRDSLSDVGNFEPLMQLRRLYMLHLPKFYFLSDNSYSLKLVLQFRYVVMGAWQLKLVVLQQQQKGFRSTGSSVLSCWFHRERTEYFISFSAILHLMRQIFQWVNGCVIAAGSLL